MQVDSTADGLIKGIMDYCCEIEDRITALENKETAPSASSNSDYTKCADEIIENVAKHFDCSNELDKSLFTRADIRNDVIKIIAAHFA